MKVNLDKDDCYKLADVVRRETAKERIYRAQLKEKKSMKPTFWNMLPFIMLIALIVYTFIVLITQYGG